MRKVGLENLILTGETEGKRNKGNQCIAYLANLRMWKTERDLGGGQR